VAGLGGDRLGTRPTHPVAETSLLAFLEAL
jgi:hypothetical protein